jgi:hypothetical protein
MSTARVRRLARTVFGSALCALLLAGSAHAFSDGEKTWNFDEKTTGGDISWTSPTAVDPAASVFNASFVITLVEVEVSLFGFPVGTLDVTSELPPESLANSSSVPGPAPITVFSDSVAFPAPPDPPSVAGTLDFGLNASGNGFLAVTNIVLGSYTGFDIDSIRVVGSLTIHAAWYDLGNGLSGTSGTPILTGDGTLKAGELVTLTLSNAAPLSSSALIVGFAQINAPFKGGTLVPSANIIFFGLPIDAGGQQELIAPWPNGAPSRFSFYFQHWVTDAGGPLGFAASNGLRAKTP